MVIATSNCTDANTGWWLKCKKQVKFTYENKKEGIMMSFGENVKLIRKERGITQE